MESMFAKRAAMGLAATGLGLGGIALVAPSAGAIIPPGPRGTIINYGFASIFPTDPLLGTNGDDVICLLANSLTARIFVDARGGGAVVYGTSLSDTIWGGSGDDVIYGYAGDDIVSGNAGDDTAWGGTGLDFIEGGAGNDKLNGESGADYVYGDADNDLIDLGSGDDHGS